MLMAADLSMRLGKLSQKDVERIDNILDMAMLPTRAPHFMDYDHYIELMAIDKKTRAGKINLVLFNKLGDAMITSDFDPGLLRETVEAHRAVSPE
jgi:3-dehydroquinate synthase